MKYIRELILVALLVFVFLMQHPFGMSMSSTGEMVVLGLFLAAFAAFIFFVFRENPRDEREEMQRSILSRIAYMSAAVVLVTGIAIREIHHMNPDPWLVGALSAMVLTKIIGSLYLKSKE